jgi:Domain of unknown function (DUF4193)
MGIGNTPCRDRVRYTTRPILGKVNNMTATDYDAPRRPAADLAEDSLEELTARRQTAQSPSVDLDEPDEELTVPVVPMRANEFRCSSCFLVHHRSQLAGDRNGQPLCRDCA